MFRRASELLPDLLSELALLKGKSRDKNNPKGWIIRALEGKVKDLLEKIEKDGMSREIREKIPRESGRSVQIAIHGRREARGGVWSIKPHRLAVSNLRLAVRPFHREKYQDYIA